MSQKDTDFGRRLAYVRWLRARGRPAPESDRELAAATDVGYPWLSKWKSRSDAPDSYEMRERFRRGLELETSWLFDGQGEPPEPQLWQHWLAQPSYLRVAEQVPIYGQEVRKTKPAKRARKRGR